MSKGKAIAIAGGALGLAGLIWWMYSMYSKMCEMKEELTALKKGRKPESDGPSDSPVYDVTPESAHDSAPQSAVSHSSVKSDISPEKAIVSVPESKSESASHSDLNVTPESAPLLQISDDLRTVKTKKHEYLTSPTQGRVICHMWEQLKKGFPSVHQDFLLEGLGVYSKKMKDVFKKSPAWKKLVKPLGKGFYRLNLE